MLHSKRLLFGFVAAGALAAAAIAGGADAQNGPPAAPLKIGILNMGDCMEAAKCDHAKELRTRFDALNKEAKEELGRIRKKADELKSRAMAVEEGSELHVQLATDYNLEEARFKIAGEMSQRRLIAARDTYNMTLYNEAWKMAAAVAQEMKLDLVFQSDDGAASQDPRETLQKNAMRSVLYHDPGLDITVAVLARLNEDYKKNKK